MVSAKVHYLGTLNYGHCVIFPVADFQLVASPDMICPEGCQWRHDVICSSSVSGSFGLPRFMWRKWLSKAGDLWEVGRDW